MTTLKTIGVFIGLAFAAALAFMGYSAIGAWRDGKLAQWKVDSTAAAQVTAARHAEAAKLDTAYLKGDVVYVHGRDRILHDTVHPPSPEVRACYASADTLLTLCAARHAADSSEKAALREELRVARAKPTLQPRRWSLYGEALYGVTAAGPDSVLGAAPVFRLGSELRLFGGIHAKTEGELRVPPAGATKPIGTLFAGIRYVF